MDRASQRAVVFSALLIQPELTISWANDLLALPGVAPRFDDQGFTNDLGVGLHFDEPRGRAGLSARHRMITERGGSARTDELTVTAEYAREADTRQTLSVVWLARGGGAFSGNLGGAWMQDSFHRALGNGRTSGDAGATRLQTIYPTNLRAGGLLGGELGLSMRASRHLRAEFGVTAQLALGATGLSSGAVYALAELRWSSRLLSAAIAPRVELSQLVTADPALTMAGGYVEDNLLLLPAIRVSARVTRLELSFEARANEGGAGHGLGQLTLGYRF